jgi:hypothetical protein
LIAARLSPRSERRRSLIAAGGRMLIVCVLLLSCLLFTLGMSSTQGHTLLFDFQGGLYDAGRAILHGHDPYRPGFLSHQAAIMRAGGVALGSTSSNAFSIPVYPAPINLLMVPFALLPLWLAGALFTLLSIAAMAVGLRLLGVRDWRCIAVALVSWPCVFALDLGALGPLLVLGIGVSWHWRDHVLKPAIAIASIVVAKVFPWPVAVWLLITRRWRAFALACAIGAVATFAAWAVIGFDGMAQYPRMLSELSQIQEARAVSLVAVLLAAGIPASLASGVALAVTGALLFGAWRFARRGAGGEAQAFGLAVIAALTSTPIVWEHYMVLLFVPIALISPRLSALWFVPCCSPLILAVTDLVAPISPSAAGTAHATIRSAVLWLLLEAIVVWRLCRAGAREVATTPVRQLAAEAPARYTPAGLVARQA